MRFPIERADDAAPIQRARCTTEMAFALINSEPAPKESHRVSISNYHKFYNFCNLMVPLPVFYFNNEDMRT